MTDPWQQIVRSRQAKSLVEPERALPQPQDITPLKIHEPKAERDWMPVPERQKRFLDMLEAQRLKIAPGTSRSR